MRLNYHGFRIKGWSKIQCIYKKHFSGTNAPKFESVSFHFTGGLLKVLNHLRSVIDWVYNLTSYTKTKSPLKQPPEAYTSNHIYSYCYKFPTHVYTMTAQGKRSFNQSPTVCCGQHQAASSSSKPVMRVLLLLLLGISKFNVLAVPVLERSQQQQSMMPFATSESELMGTMRSGLSVLTNFSVSKMFGYKYTYTYYLFILWY